jgi:putative selenium metabolism protein SsnA
MPDSLLIKNATIITLGDAPRVLHDHAVLIEDGRIRKVAHLEEFGALNVRSLDAYGKILLPGFINAHMHFYSTLAKGLVKAKPARSFIQKLENLWWRLDKALTLEDCYYSALIVMIEAIKHGTTTLIDHHASPHAISGVLQTIAEAVKQTGLRVCLCYETSDRDGEQIAKAGLEENGEFIRSCADEKSEHLKALFGLHAAFTLSDSTLKAAADMGNTLNTGFHIHVAEAQSDQEYNLEKHGLRVIERLHKFGILGPKTIAAHCVHIDDHERTLLVQTETNVVHNPQSNMNNAVGIMDLMRMQQSGVTVGLGTDAMTVNMLEELRTALWAQHLLQQDASAGFEEVTSTLLQNNPRFANRIWDIPMGAIAEGYAGDVILVDYFPATPLNEETYAGHLVFGISQAQVDTTIVGGVILMENKKLTVDIDEREIAAKARDLSKSLWDRF